MTKINLNNHKIKSVCLSIAIITICIFVTWLAGGTPYLLETIVTITLLLILAPYISPNVVLSMHQAKFVSTSQAKVIHELVHHLSHRANLRHNPKIHYIQSSNYIAFTVGSGRNAAIALSDGLLLKLNKRELNAVIAHEVAHIKNQDYRIMLIANMASVSVFAISLLTLVAYIVSLPLVIFNQTSMSIITLILFLIASYVIFHLRIQQSRTRELLADHNAATICEDPNALISALEKLEHYHWRWVEKLFFVRSENPIPLPFRSHPENEERIQYLKEIAKTIKKPGTHFEFSHFGLTVPKHLREIRSSLYPS